MKKHPTLKIIAKHTFTLFNFVNIVLAVMVALVGSYKNMLFIVIAVANTLIGIINELRAKRIVDKMRLIAEQNPTVIRDGKPYQINPKDVQKGDLIVLSLGDQILFDSTVKEGSVEVNESFITGEQDNVKKSIGDRLISGSFVVSGTAKASVDNIGADNFVNKLESAAHTIKTADSKLFVLINKIVRYISYALVPIGALLLWSRFRTEPDTATAVTSTVAGLINMIPEGLVLLTSSVLALATIRLSRKKVLVQDLYSIETLARVDCIALDKTGTLTTGKMSVIDLIPAKGQSKNSLENALMAILSHIPADNATSIALKQKLLKTAKFEPTTQIVEIIPFSSDRKYSGIKTKKAEILMGAPEFLLQNKDDLAQAKAYADNYRVIAVVKNSRLLGFVLLEDELRPDATQIISYFKENDIAVKIISGDNLRTVEKIATRVGVESPSAVDLSELSGSLDYDSLVKTYNIFTRVKPAQKKSLILALKRQGHTVAMTGDGVNDILAMKEADVSLAIGDGSDAARRAAKLVLLSSDFAAVPPIIDEGRQSINNLERSTTLFLAKTVYASILAVLFVFLPFSYPFSPIEMSLLNTLCIGLPGLILALEKNTSRIKNRFARNIIEYSFPVGLTVTFAMLILAIIAHVNDLPRAELTTASAFITFTIDVILIYWISHPLNKLRGSLLAGIIAVMLAAFFVPFSRSFFEFTFLPLNSAIITLAVLAVAVAFFFILKSIATRLANKILTALHI